MTDEWTRLTELPAAEVLQSAAPRPAEQYLAQLLPELETGGALLTTSLGYGQLARAAARRFPASPVVCWYLDLFQSELARRAAAAENLPNLEFCCSTDFPQREFSAAALCFSSQGEADLTRDLLQEACERLSSGGRLLASTDNPRDTWLGEQLDRLFDRTKRSESEHAAAYAAVKTGPLKKRKNYACEFAFRDQGRLVRVKSRPGVFSHRRLDGGARKLLEAFAARPGKRILEIGCGSGAVSLAAAMHPGVERVLAVDSSARAIACVEEGIALNALTNVFTQHEALGGYRESGSFDLVLCNPPYYGQYQVAARFLAYGVAALSAGGRLLAVTKSPQWYREHAACWLIDLELVAAKDYWIVSGRKAG